MTERSIRNVWLALRSRVGGSAAEPKMSSGFMAGWAGLLRPLLPLLLLLLLLSAAAAANGCCTWLLLPLLLLLPRCAANSRT
jgi:hypothetical protein